MSLILALLALQTLPDYKELYGASRRGVENLKARIPEAKGKPDLADEVLLALERGEASDTAAFRELLADVLSRPPASTRGAALQAMTLVRLDRVKYRPRIADCVQLILDQQAADGLWGPGGPVESLNLPGPPPGPKRPFGEDPSLAKPVPLRLEARAKGPETGDAANAVWAALGLRFGAAAKLGVPEDLLDRGIEAWRRPDRPATAVASALSTLLLLRGRDWKKDPDVRRAAASLEEAPFPSTPADLLALRDALIVLDRDRLGDRDWYRMGGAALLKSQRPDGSWEDLETTARAVLFIGAQPRPIQLPDSR